MLPVLFALIFVEHAEDPADHFPRRIVTRLLRDGEHTNATPLEVPFVQAEFQRVPKETREAMHHNRLEGRRTHTGFRDHPLKDRAPIIRSGCAGLHIFSCRTVALGFAPRPHLAQLIRYREIFLGLFTRRDSGI
ncbi:MAG TPA: hypothetical protein VEI50_10095 [Nitrospiraceae bacterium]|nr:hypothetical protein [Nitrospiraceae bacterium]